MDALAGLPDFQAPFSSGGLLMYAPFQAGSFSVLPEKLDVAVDSSGLPKFQLSLVKHANDPNGMDPYAALDVALNGDFSLDEALTSARNLDSGATVKPADLHTGFARLYPTGDALTLPADMLTPIALDWSGSDFVRWRMRLSLDAGELIKGALSNSTLLFGACVEFSVVGVIPRVEFSVQFRPAELMAALLAKSSGGELSNREIAAFFAQSLNELPIRVIGSLTGVDIGLLPEIMADRIAAEFGSVVPATTPGDPSIVHLPHPDELETATVTWDLSEATAAPRQFVMTLDPLRSLQCSNNGDVVDGLVKEITIPPLDLGLRSLSLVANLPTSRVGVLAIGANVQVPPNPPLRPDAISETATLTPPDDEALVNFRLSPDEPFLYALSTFAVLAAGRSVQEYTSAPRQLNQPWVRLQASDFPVNFVHLTAVDRLLNLASLTGTLSYSVDGRAVQEAFTLNSGTPDIALAVPTSANDGLITLATVPKDGGPTLSLSPLVPGNYRLDVTSFREYGPHILTIQCAFLTDDGLLAIDLMPEERGGDESALSTFTCTAAQPWGTWGYTTSSPFKCGYRYRKSAMAGDQPNAWSEILSPFVPLMLREDGTMDTSGNVSSFDLDGTHFYAQAVRPDTLYYIPAEPVPELDSQGRPMLTLLQTTSISTLQLGVQFTLSAETQKTALAQIAVQHPTLATARLQPAFIRVQKVRVLLADSSGNLTELKSAISSSFPPYTTVFSISLSPEQAAQVAGAINGRSGLLFVEYSIAVPAEVGSGNAAPKQEVRRADVANWFPGSEGAAHLRLAG